MRAIGVLKILLMMGLVADVGVAVAVEDLTRAQGLLQGRQFQERHFDGRKPAQASSNRTAVARAAVVQPIQVAASALRSTRQYAGGGSADLRVASLSASEVLNADLFATDRSAIFASPLSTASSFAARRIAGAPDEGFTADDQLRNIVLLRQRIDAARMRSAGDVWLLTLVGVMLVAYQLCRKHRFLRPQPFAL